VILLVCGGRAFPHQAYVDRVLDVFHARTPIDFLITGDAKRRDWAKVSDSGEEEWLGADWFAYLWARTHRVPYRVFPADWVKHGAAAGPIRNQQMLDDGHPSLVLAFEGQKGTSSMCSLARRAGVKVVRAREIVPAEVP
jgi:hypothetical protein